MTLRESKKFWCSPLVLLLAACGDDDVDVQGTCGDGQLQTGEACDDGNANAGDGCSSECSVEAGFACPPLAGLPCTTTCGDSIRAGVESCDDGNSSSGDGCSATCTVEEPGAEVCDDEVDNDRDGLADCDDTDCASVCPVAENCTDGIDSDLDGQTDCDDTDCANDPACVPEPLVEDCSAPGDEDGNGAADCDDATCTCDCGDGRLNGDEQCDDGADNDDMRPNACRSTCVNAFCGDDVVDTGEQCDGSSPAGSVCEDCALRVVPVCGESGRYLELAFVPGDDLLSVPLDFGSSAVDDFALPTSCTAINGRDITALLTVPVDGTYVLELVGQSETDRFAVSRSGSCDAPFATQCASASRGRSAALVMELKAAEPQVFRMEATSATTGATLNVQRVDGIVPPGATCVADDPLLPCAPGFTCSEVTGNLVCASVDVMPGMVGETCSPGVPGECLPGAECAAATSLCEPLAGTTCSTSTFLDDVMTADGERFDLDLVRSIGALQGTCESLPSTIAVNLDLSRPTWVQVEGTSSDGSPLAISARSSCALVASESSCLRNSSGAVSTEFFLSGGGDGGTLLVSGFSSVGLTVSRIPARSVGESCDRTGVSSRCAPGLECPSGSCVPSLAGSCGDPLPGFLAAEGELIGRGLAVSFDTGTVTPTTRPDCSTPLRRQVFRFQSPATGSLQARLGESATGAFVELDGECTTAPVLIACALNQVASRVVRSGEFFDVSVSSQDEAAGILTLALEVQSDVGSECSADLGCLPGLQCVVGRCQSPLLLPGASCVPSESVCTAGNACLPGEFGFTCRSAVAGERQACETFGDLPACIESLVCVDEGGGKLCSTPVVPDCTSDTQCGAAFRCDAGRCVARSGLPEGSSCDIFTPTSCADGLVCTVGSDLLLATCVAPATSCDETTSCGAGRLCVDGTCYEPLALGERCSPTSPPPCQQDLACAGAAGSEVCAEVAGGAGSECASSSDCLAGLFCNLLGVPGVCRDRLAIGSLCTGVAPDECVAGASCERTGGMFRFCTALP
jgi:cysteine-rich repeat protein